MAVSSIDDGGGEPLASLYEAIERARDLEPAEAPEARGETPVETIRAWIDEDADEIGRREEPLAYGVRPEPALRSEPPSSGEPGSLEAVIGREVLEMLADEPLASEARARAARLLAEALENPTRDAIRRVLRVILAG